MDVIDTDTTAKPRQFKCKGCGAMLEFAPGTNALRCPYCAAMNEIASSDTVIEELDFRKHIAKIEEACNSVEQLVVHCNACGADTTMEHNTTASFCPFCGHPVVAQGMSRRVLKPQSLLPFGINRDVATKRFQRWMGELWFAPNALKRAAQKERFHGVYLPAWTYDSITVSAYTGQRGDDYWVNESYTAFVNGRAERRSRQVRKTRWSHAAGTVRVTFDDVMVMASDALPPKMLEELEPWDLGNLVPYQDEYLSGFKAESYHIDLAQGFGIAQQIMDDRIRYNIRADIGGDHQRINTVNTRHFNITFKHLLVPVWISAYRYHNQIYRFVINARTGEVQGERPWSVAKIASAVIAGIIALAAVYLATMR